MAQVNFQDRPLEDIAVSAHQPIKFTVRVKGSGAADMRKYKSVDFLITPVNQYTGEDETDNQVSIRVQHSPVIHDTVNSIYNDDDAYRFFSLDISSICRDFLSFDLRACTQDTSAVVQRDITQSMTATKLYKKFKITAVPEKLEGSTLTKITAESVDSTVVAANVALSDEEQNTYALGDFLFDGDTVVEQNSELHNAFTHDYKHYTNSTGGGTAKYLTMKPNHRIIGTDECEYLTFIARELDNKPIDVRVIFYDSSGNALKTGFDDNDGDSNDEDFYYEIQYSPDGAGNYSAGFTVLSHGGTSSDSEFEDPEIAIAQIGVGTRNITEARKGFINSSEGKQKFGTVWDNISYYTVQTLEGGTTKAVGELLTYHIDHESDRKKYEARSVRFHWQSRMGGIDSYTFDGLATESISTSSKMYEETIYPFFQSRLREVSALGLGANPNVKETFGTLPNRVGGLTSDEYRSGSKSQVKAFRQGQAVSRPYPIGERFMMEDLLSSPNVWIERGWKGRDIYFDNFSSYANKAELANSYTIAGDADDDITFLTGEDPLSGTKCLSVGNNSGTDFAQITFNTFIPIDTKKIYRFEIRVRKVSGTNGTYFGHNEYNASQANNLKSGSADNYFQYPALADGDSSELIVNSADWFSGVGVSDVSTVGEWLIFTGYGSGEQLLTQYNDNRRSPNEPMLFIEGTKFIKPFILANYNTGAGQTLVDYVKITEFTSDVPNIHNNYSTLNKHYYVPVNIKDGSNETFTSEGQSSMTINYVESKQKRTID